MRDIACSTGNASFLLRCESKKKVKNQEWLLVSCHALKLFIYTYYACARCSGASLLCLLLFLSFYVLASSSLVHYNLEQRFSDARLRLPLNASTASGFGFLRLSVCSRRLGSFFRSCWRSRERLRLLLRYCRCCWVEAVEFVVETFV